MSDIAMPMRFDVDLKSTLVTRRPITLLMQGDAMANQIVIQLTEDGKAFAPVGCTVEARLIRNDGMRVKCRGTIEGSVVTVELDGACYEIAGAYAMFARLVNEGSGQRRTILRIAGEIESEGDGPVIEGGRIFYTIDELLSQIERMETGTTAMEEATEDARRYAVDAKNAARKIDGMTVASEEGERTSANITEKNGAKHIDFTLRRGEPGYGMKVLGMYATYSALELNVISPAQGDMYLVGTGAPYSVYMYNNIGSQTGWIYLGEAQGAGINSVANVRPDAGGNVPLTIEHIGALGKNETAVDAQKLGGKLPKLYETQDNLLDNGNFAFPVNQRKQTAYSGAEQQTIDRWMASETMSVTLGDRRVTLACESGAAAPGRLRQYIAKEQTLAAGETLTLAVMDAAGVMHIGTVTGSGDAFADGVLTGRISAEDGYVDLLVSAGKSAEIVWALLLRGEYAEEDIAYKPRRYADEFFNCARYYQKIYMRRPPVSFSTATVAVMNVPLLAPLRRKDPAVRMLTGPTDVRYNDNTRAISVSSVETPDNNVEEQGVAIVYLTFSPGLPSTSNVYNVGFMSNAVELELDCNLPDAVDKGEDV